MVMVGLHNDFCRTHIEEGEGLDAKERKERKERKY
jgi:hypothetical protein